MYVLVMFRMISHLPVFVQIGGGWQDHDLADLTLTWMAVCRRTRRK